MLRKLLAIVIVVIAILLATLAIFLPPEHLRLIIRITNFFDVMIPILAVGALLNYLWHSNMDE